MYYHQLSNSLPHSLNQPRYYQDNKIKDYGPAPFVVDIDKTATHNNTFRTALWTGNHLQVTVMSIPVGGDVGLEVHPHNDQLLCIVEGSGLVQMGDNRDNLFYRQPAFEESLICVPAGTWHNVVNTGREPLKLYAVYGPPDHPWGTVEPVAGGYSPG